MSPSLTTAVGMFYLCRCLWWRVSRNPACVEQLHAGFSFVPMSLWGWTGPLTVWIHFSLVQMSILVALKLWDLMICFRCRERPFRTSYRQCDPWVLPPVQVTQEPWRRSGWPLQLTLSLKWALVTSFPSTFPSCRFRREVLPVWVCWKLWTNRCRRLWKILNLLCCKTRMFGLLFLGIVLIWSLIVIQALSQDRNTWSFFAPSTNVASSRSHDVAEDGWGPSRCLQNLRFWMEWWLRGSD